MTDDEITQMPTRKRWIVQLGYDNWAMPIEDLLTMVSIFSRSTKVELIHTSDYRRSVWLAAADQSPPFEAMSMAPVRVETEMEPIDHFAAATRETSNQ